MPSMASLIAFSLEKVTNPNPLDLPVSRSLMLRFKDFAKGRESILQRLAVGGPCEPSDETSVLDVGGTHLEKEE
uniref:Uncharacterized protein n=1 Tax=Cannabis sativa TaxID=3483 RepID=A0A803QY18_CANSA